MTSTNNHVDDYQDTGISKGVFMLYWCALKKTTNNKDGFQNHIGGFHQDKFEIISQRRGNNAWIPTNQCWWLLGDGHV